MAKQLDFIRMSAVNGQLVINSKRLCCWAYFLDFLASIDSILAILGLACSSSPHLALCFSVMFSILFSFWHKLFDQQTDHFTLSTITIRSCKQAFLTTTTPTITRQIDLFVFFMLRWCMRLRTFLTEISPLVFDNQWFCLWIMNMLNISHRREIDRNPRRQKIMGVSVGWLVDFYFFVRNKSTFYYFFFIR